MFIFILVYYTIVLNQKIDNLLIFRTEFLTGKHGGNWYESHENTIRMNLKISFIKKL